MRQPQAEQPLISNTLRKGINKVKAGMAATEQMPAQDAPGCEQLLAEIRNLMKRTGRNGSTI